MIISSSLKSIYFNHLNINTVTITGANGFSKTSGIMLNEILVDELTLVDFPAMRLMSERYKARPPLC